MNQFLLFTVGTFFFALSFCFANSSLKCPDHFEGKLLSVVKSKSHSEIKFKNKSFTVPNQLAKNFRAQKIYKISSVNEMICQYQEISNEN